MSIVNEEKKSESQVEVVDESKSALWVGLLMIGIVVLIVVLHVMYGRS
jgi:ABC-type lipoprotein release transport system permease subunit